MINDIMYTIGTKTWPQAHTEERTLVAKRQQGICQRWVGLEERRENDCSSEKSSYLVMDTPGTVNIDASASEGESNRKHFNREHQACL